MNRLFILLILIAIVTISGCVGQTQSPSGNQETTTVGQQTTTTTESTTTTVAQNIAISYSGTIKNEIDYTMGDYPYTAQPNSGKTFLVVNMAIKNNGYDKFNTNPYYFHVAVNNIQYDYDSNTYYLADKLDSVDVLNGGTLTGSLVFQIPTSVASAPFNLTYDVPFVTYNIIWSKV